MPVDLDSINAVGDTRDASDTFIVSMALRMATEGGWYNLSLVELAGRCDLSVNALRDHFADANAIADAWFAAALRAMLQPLPDGFDDRSARERLELVLWRWFEALAPHRRVTVEMLKTKLHLPHFHHWLPMPFDLSRLVQLWRELSGLRADGHRRQVEEIALTAIFLATLADWCNGASDGAQWPPARIRARLGQRLGRAERGARLWFRPGRIGLSRAPNRYPR